MGVHGWEIPFEKFQEFALVSLFSLSHDTTPACLDGFDPRKLFHGCP